MKKRCFLCVFSLIIVLVLLMHAAPLVSAEGKTIVVGNSQDWHALYLLSSYAALSDAEFAFFNNLGDAQIKTKTMGLTDEVIIYESSSKPVVKNYRSFLAVEGFSNFRSYYFDDISDLQGQLIERHDADGYIVFGTDFGMEPYAAVPYLVKNNYLPLFYTEDAHGLIARLSRNKPLLFVGRIPVREIDSLEGKRYIGTFQESTSAMTRLVLEDVSSEWGVISRIDVVDFDTFGGGLPIFVYYGENYMDAVVDLVKQSSITRFEVVGGSTADIATEIESRSGKDLQLLLKYGRRITQYEGLEDTVMDLDSKTFSFPVESLDVVSMTYYPNLQVLGVTYENKGNVDLLYFSNIEFSDEALADEYAHHLMPGERKTIPYVVSGNHSQTELVFTSRYGNAIPFKQSIVNQDGDSIVPYTVSYDEHVESPSLTFLEASFDSRKGILYLDYLNPTGQDLLVYSEFLFSPGTDVGVVYSSPVQTILAKKTGRLSISFPYVQNDDLLGKEFEVISYYGHKDTLNVYRVPVLVKAAPLLALWHIIVIVFVVFLVAFFIFLLIKRRKRKKDEHRKPRRSKKTKVSNKKTKKT